MFKNKSAKWLTMMCCAFACLVCMAVARPSAAQNVPEFEQAPVCVSVARVFGETICYHDFGESEEAVEAIRETAKSEGNDPDKAVQARNLQRLRQYVWFIGLAKRYGAEALTPSEEEVDQYFSTFRQALDENYETDKKIHSYVSELLKKYEYLPQDQRKLEEILASAEKSIRFYEARDARRADLPQEYQQYVDDAQKRVFRSKIRQWKINKTLYDDFGGRLVLRDTDLEPVDAYGALIKYIRSDGELKIIEPAYNNIFKVIEDYVATPVGVLNKEELAKYKGYFLSPTWHFEKQLEDKNFKILRHKLNAVPFERIYDEPLKEVPKTLPFWDDVDSAADREEEENAAVGMPSSDDAGRSASAAPKPLVTGQKQPPSPQSKPADKESSVTTESLLNAAP